MGDISAVINLTFDVKFLNSDKLKFSFKLNDKKIKLFDFYYSVDFDEYGLTQCPHKQYLFTVTVLDARGNPASGAIVNDKDNYVTDINGRTSFYLSPGSYTITAKADDGATASKSCTVTDEPVSIVLNLSEASTEPTTEPTEPTTEPTTVPVTEPTTQPVTEPQKVESQISLGQNYSGVLLENGDLYMWGYNWNGQLGDGTTVNKRIPTKITLPAKYTMSASVPLPITRQRLSMLRKTQE